MQQHPPHQTHQKLKSGAALTVLLVDDDPDCRALVREALAEATEDGRALEVHEVEDGEMALQFLRRQGPFSAAPRPDLIYLDMEMPRMDGLTALKQIKMDPDLVDIPIVMFTGVADEAKIRLAAELGANSYTIKPIDIEQLFRTIAASKQYWFDIHQSPSRRLAQERC